MKWRYPLSDGYLFFSLVLSFLALYMGLSIRVSDFVLKLDEEAYHYKNEKEVTLYNRGGGALNIYEMVEGCRCVVIMSQVPISNDTIKSGQLIDVLLNAKEDLLFPGQNGKRINYTTLMDKPNSVVMGFEQVKDAERKDNGEKVVRLNGKEFMIVEITHLSSSELFDYTFLINARGLDKQDMDEITGQMEISLFLGSDVYDVSEDIRQMKENLKKTGADAQLVVGASSISRTFGIEEGEDRFYFLLYAFCMIHCLVSAEFWLWSRKNELAIRRVLGAETKDIFFVLMKACFAITAQAAVLCFALQWAVAKLGSKMLHIYLRFDMWSAFSIFAFVCISAFVIAAYMTMRISRMTCTEALAESDRR